MKTKYQIKRWWCVRVVDISFVVIPKWGHFQVNYTYFLNSVFFSLLVNLSSILIRMCMLLFADFVIQNARSIHSFVEIFVEHQRKNSFVFYVTRVGLSDGNSRGFFLIWDSFRFFSSNMFFVSECARVLVCLCECECVYVPLIVYCFACWWKQQNRNQTNRENDMKLVSGRISHQNLDTFHVINIVGCWMRSIGSDLVDGVFYLSFVLSCLLCEVLLLLCWLFKEETNIDMEFQVIFTHILTSSKC